MVRYSPVVSGGRRHHSIRAPGTRQSGVDGQSRQARSRPSGATAVSSGTRSPASIIISIFIILILLFFRTWSRPASFRFEGREPNASPHPAGTDPTSEATIVRRTASYCDQRKRVRDRSSAAPEPAGVGEPPLPAARTQGPHVLAGGGGVVRAVDDDKSKLLTDNNSYIYAIFWTSKDRSRSGLSRFRWVQKYPYVV